MSSLNPIPALFATVLLLTIPLTAAAENGTAYKIGVVNSKEIFDNYNKQTEEYAKLRVKRDAAQEPIDLLSEQITKDKEHYDTNADTMPEDEKRVLEEKIESAVTRYKAEFERAQQDIDRLEKKLLREILEDIQIAIQEVGAKYDYHLIFENGQENISNLAGRAGGLLYSSTTLNMTQRVIDHLNEQQ